MTLPRRKNSLRYRGYDYGSPGTVFVTVCSHNRHRLFGKVCDGVMHLNTQGQLVRECWEDIPDRYPDLEMDEVVVMPDHLHAIVHVGVEMAATETQFLVSQAIRSFKSRTVRIWADHVKRDDWPRYTRKLWQRSFNDVILNLDRPIDEVREYILSNPARWQAKQDGQMP